MVRIPGSTYRLQLHKGFGFKDAAAIAEYLSALGVTHVYSSPYLQAAPGSMHGYDVVDHRVVNEELGGPKAHHKFCKTLGEHGLGQVLDIVPNHMSLGEQNRYWWDVLKNGSSSRYASFFDIDWNSTEERLRDKVLVPILADQYGRVLEAGDIKVVRKDGEFRVEAAGQSLPVAPQTLTAILQPAADAVHDPTLSFLSVSYGRLPTPDMTDRRTVLVRHRDEEVLDKLLRRLCEEDAKSCKAIDASLERLSKDADALDDFLNHQNYRLAYWKTADQQLGYRRFFDVNTLIGLRTERDYVFEETHALVLDWLSKGVIDGVRVDHPDGLRDPKQYFERLRERAPKAWIVGEKILARGEFLRESWPIEGTSGYDFLNMVGGLLVDPAGVEALGKVYTEFTGDDVPFPVTAHDKKIAVTQEALGSDVNRLTGIFVEICESNRQHRDHTRSEVRRAIRELAACMGIYRTYVQPERGEITDEDKAVLAKATQCAKDNRTDMDASLFDFLLSVLTLEVRGERESEFVARFQQFTSPVMAKGVEDTAFYVYNRLTALNEVGADPGRAGVTVDEFHDYQQRMQSTHPGTMVGLSTHDTKRSDDVRARMYVLSEMPEEFGAQVQSWNAMTAQYRSERYPDRRTEWFYYQTLVGAWPLDAERATAYMMKAMHEAKLETSWVAANEEYEKSLTAFIEGTLKDAGFCASVTAFVAKLEKAWQANSLAQTLMKHTAPGVPDMYQGGELWDFSLVDPDNRRPVDYELRRKLLAEVKSMDAAAVMARAAEGLPKLWVVQQALHLRKEKPGWFDEHAAYVPLPVKGTKCAHAVAYLRGANVVTVAPRLTLRRAEGWGTTAVVLPHGTWTNRLTGVTLEAGNHSLDEILKDFPVALLVRDEAGEQRDA